MSKHSFSIDLEEWFCSHNLAESVPFEVWSNQKSLIDKQVDRLLLLLDKSKVKATWFSLGWVVERYPELLERISNENHEIASHGYYHKLTWDHTEASFAEDLKKSTDVITSITGIRPSMFRAPAFSIVKRTNWALAILKEQGYKTDSSIYPISIHPEYGWGDISLEPFFTANGIYECPMSCVTYPGFRFPISGGAYLRFLNYSIYKKLIHRLEKQGRNLNFYIHPWEIDDNLPEVKGLSLSKRIRHNYGVGKSAFLKLEKLLSDFEFSTLSTSNDLS